MKRIKYIIIFIPFLSILIPALSLAGNMSVIVHPSNGLNSLPGRIIVKQYKLIMTNWPSSNIIDVINLPKDNPVRITFCKTILKASPTFYEKLYIKKALIGRGHPPKTLKSSEEVVKYIASNVNAIGYVDASKVDSSVKVLSVDGKKEFKY